VNANAGEWNLIIKKFSSKSQEISYHKRRFIVNLKNENWTLKTMKMRDLMNNTLKKTKIDLIVVMIVKTHLITTVWEQNNWRQQSIKAYNISNQSTSYKAQSYDQNKLSFDSITLQMTALQVKNRKSKIFALTQVKIGDETRVHQCRRKNHQFRQ